MSLTVTGTAQYYYDRYALTNNSSIAAGQLSQDDASRKYYGVSNLSNALSSLNSNSADIYLTNLNNYVKNRYELSQTDDGKVESILSATSHASASGSAQTTSKYAYLQNSLGLGSSGVNINSVLDPAVAAQYAYMAQSLPVYDQNALQLGDSLGQYVKGSLLDVMF